MDSSKLIFISGLHRSGTSLLHRILRAHPDISGFSNTGVPEDEGQHLQTVYPTARHYGGPGIFAYHPEAYMTETHPLATPENAEKIWQSWRPYWDSQKSLFIEKSPPNIIRTRFLQKLFPEARFLTILRHPIPVAYATLKWSQTSIPELIEHNLRCYESYQEDRKHLHCEYTLHYEALIQDTEKTCEDIYQWLGIDACPIQENIKTKINQTYFKNWQKDQKKKAFKQCLKEQVPSLENRLAAFSYQSNPPYWQKPMPS